MKIKGNNNNVIINSQNGTSPDKRKRRLTLVTILTVISLLAGIYNDAHKHIIKFLTEEKESSDHSRSLDYEHATYGDNSKKRVD